MSTKETETIDRLFPKLSQFTSATTAEELALQQRVGEQDTEIARLRASLAGGGVVEKWYTVTNASTERMKELEAKCAELEASLKIQIRWTDEAIEREERLKREKTQLESFRAKVLGSQKAPDGFGQMTYLVYASDVDGVERKEEDGNS